MKLDFLDLAPFLALLSNLLFFLLAEPKVVVALTNFWFSFLYAFYKSTFGLDLLEDKDPNKSTEDLDLLKDKDPNKSTEDLDLLKAGTSRSSL